MKEKVAKSQRTGLVMDCMDFVVLTFLLMAFGTTIVFANSRKELNEHCQIVNECNTIGYMCAKNRACQCRPGYIPNEEWTKCVGFVNSKCFYDSHCIKGAYCTSSGGVERCKCRELDRYYTSEDGQTCTSSAISRHHEEITYSVLLALICTNLYLNT